MTKYVKSTYRRPIALKAIAWHIPSKIVRILIFALMVIVGLLYIIQTNTIALHGYRMKELEKILFSLKEENEYLRLESADLQSVQKIKQQLQSFHLVPIDKLDYISSQAPQVAKK